MNGKQALLIGTLVLTACSLTGNVTHEEPVTVGALLSLTGNAAIYGEGELQAVQMAIDEANANGGINGHPIKLAVEDAGTLNQAKAITALRKLHTVNNADVIIGPTWDMPGVAAVAERENIVMISPDNTAGVEHNTSYSYFFSTWHPQRAEAQRLATYASEQNWTDVAIITDHNIFSTAVTNAFKHAAAENNITITQEFKTAQGTKDFKTQLLKLQTNVDAVLATFASETPRGPLLRQMKELGINTPMLGTAAVQNQAFLDNYGRYAESVYYTYPITSPREQTFLQRYTHQFNTPPGPAASNAYDAANIAVEALQHARAPSQMKHYLLNNSFETVTFGNMTFNTDGFVATTAANVGVKTVQDGNFTWT